MKLVIDISNYDKEWITNGYYIPEEINIKISEAIANGTPIPDNATNGDVFGKIMDYMFMDDAYITTDKHGYLHLRGVKDDWWNSPYQKGGKE